MRSFLLFIFSFFVQLLSAQQTDSVFVLKIISAGDSGVKSDCQLKLEEDRVLRRSYSSDVNGIVKVSAKGILNQYYNLTIEQNGQTLVFLKLDSLPLNDTFLVSVPRVLHDVEIISYLVPVVEKEQPWWQKKNTRVVFVPDTIYSADTLAKIERLKKGEWEWTDTSDAVLTSEGDFYRYFARTLDYPTSAYNNLIQGIVVVEFMLDKNEKITTIKLIYSKDPALALAVVKVFENMPALKFLQPAMITTTTHYEDNVIEGHSRPDEISFVEAKPSVYRIKVNFKLR